MSEDRFAKINFRVRDVHAAFEYAQAVLGGVVVTAPHTTPIGEVALVQLHGLVMELIQPPEGSPMAATIDRRGEGIDSIGFVTDDVAASSDEIERRGGRLVRPSDPGLAETIWVHPKNPMSVSIELFAASTSEIFGPGTASAGG